jgi:hypothetical protein
MGGERKGWKERASKRFDQKLAAKKEDPSEALSLQ